MSQKVILVNGSPRPGGNTSIMLGWVAEEVESGGIKTETLHLGGQTVNGCRACGACGKPGAKNCVQKDLISDFIPRIAEADALVLGSPVYFADLTPELKALIDRAGFVLKHTGNALRRKPGAAVVVARRAGQVHTYDSINHFFGIMEMITVGSTYWNLGQAREKGQIREDAEAEETMRNLGRNLAWLLGRLAN